MFDRGSSLPPDAALRFPHPILPSRELDRRAPKKVALFGHEVALRRAADGVVLAEAAPESPALHASERNGFIWLGAPGVSPAARHDYSAEGLEQVGAVTTRFEAPLHVAFDNFSEDEHTPWVHSFLGWRARDAGIVDFEARLLDDRTEVDYRGVQRPHALTPTILVRWGDHFENKWTTTFDPPCTVYTLRWRHPETGAPRPVTARFAIYFVAETARTTLLSAIVFAKVEPGWRVLMPIVRRYVPLIGQREIEDDQRFIPTVADTPYSFTGMRLGRFDRPLVHNRKLLERLYLASR